MTNRNDLVPAQEKLQWVTPKISLMDTDDTQSGVFIGPVEDLVYGPSGTKIAP
jgi:hypothetical protein